MSLGHTVVKPNAKKVRRINENIVAGFAGSTADAYTLMERLENKLEAYPGQLTRACVELAKAWRTDKYLRRLEVRRRLLSWRERETRVRFTHSPTLSLSVYLNSFE